jgi:phage-related minor tail protein
LANQFDSALTARLREVVAGGSVTETELRELIEQADGWARTLEARVEAGERTLAKLTADPAGSMVEIADELRRVEMLRPELEEVRRLLADLETRARELRAGWLRAGK